MSDWADRRIAAHTRGRALDVGCGDGRLLRPGDVGLDRDVARVRLARARSALVCVGDVHALPFAAASFDTVHAHRMLNDAGRIDHALAELQRVLRPGGRLLVHTRARAAPGERLDAANGERRLRSVFAEVVVERDPGDERAALFIATG